MMIQSIAIALIVAAAIVAIALQLSIYRQMLKEIRELSRKRP